MPMNVSYIFTNININDFSCGIYTVFVEYGGEMFPGATKWDEHSTEAYENYYIITERIL